MINLTNNEEIIKQFKTILNEIIKTNQSKISDISFLIRDKMHYLGTKILELWFSQNIGNGYQGTKIMRQINGDNKILRFNNYLEKSYLSCMGEVRLKRAYYQGESIGYFPIEESHPYLKDEFLPDVKELSCFVSMNEPYDMASEMLSKVGGITISGSSLQKITKSIGKILVQQEDDSIDKTEYDHSHAKKVDLLVLSCDGTCVNTKDGWKEVKNGAIYEVKKNKQDELVAYNKSYISRIESHTDFGKRLYEESKRRNLWNAKELVTIGDGAKWIWKMFENYYPQSIEIVDWYHATEHLWKIIEYMYGSKSTEDGKEFEEKCEDLLYDGLILLMKDTITDKLKYLNIREKSNRYNSIMKELNYFENNAERMKYSLFREKGYPIGSGVIEGTCKHLVQIRLKRNGMKWSISGAHAILQLRCYYFNNRWDEVKEVIENAA